jgi:fructose-specific component phosphotransferase system IIB-like protein
MTRLTKLLGAIAMLIGLLGVAGPAAAELPLVNGTLWKASSLAEKRAYLIGIANTVAVERAVIAKKTGADPGSMSGRMSNGLSAQSIDAAVKKIDEWYAANPSRTDMPVLGVVWTGLVKGR